MQVTEKKVFSNKVFIVHGSNGELKEKVARIVESCDLKAIILHEQSNGGKTIIEKIENNSDVGFAFVLMTADDFGYKKGHENEIKTRARQNVILELGYFMAKLGRERIFIVCDDKKMEIPSDISGICLGYMEDSDLKQNIAKELKSAGYEIDFNKVMG